MANPKQEVKYTKIFINNEFVDSVSGKKFATYNPATEQKIADISEGDEADINLAVAAAKKAFARGSEYRNLDASARGKLLWKLADLIERDHLVLANLESQDGGKPFNHAIYEILGCAKSLRYYAGWADKSHGKTIPADGSFFAYTRKEPVGVVGQIIPWNGPLAMLCWKWGCAVAAGCTSVLKPAEQTPLTALYAAALAKEAGFPPGVLNVVPGFGPTAGNALTVHPDVRKIAFTGSLEVGRIIMANAAKSNLKKVSLELGGKSPLVVFDDADLEIAVQTAHVALFANQGQVCCAGSRLFVQEGIYDKFVKRAVEVAKARRVGDPYNQTTEQGPQINGEQFDRILGYIDLGLKQGAKLETGGKRHGNKGFFIEPTVFSNVTDEMTIAKEEIFGPVQSIIKFKTLDEVIERANNTNFGLAAGVITNNIETALTFSHAVEAGSVWVNTYLAISPQTPFGGYKESGLGRELGEDGLDLYLETKLVSIKLPTKN